MSNWQRAAGTPPHASSQRPVDEFAAQAQSLLSAAPAGSLGNGQQAQQNSEPQSTAAMSPRTPSQRPMNGNASQAPASMASFLPPMGLGYHQQQRQPQPQFWTARQQSSQWSSNSSSASSSSQNGYAASAMPSTPHGAMMPSGSGYLQPASFPSARYGYADAQGPVNVVSPFVARNAVHYDQELLLQQHAPRTPSPRPSGQTHRQGRMMPSAQQPARVPIPRAQTPQSHPPPAQATAAAPIPELRTPSQPSTTTTTPLPNLFGAPGNIQNTTQPHLQLPARPGPTPEDRAFQNQAVFVTLAVRRAGDPPPSLPPSKPCGSSPIKICSRSGGGVIQAHVCAGSG